MPSFLRWLPSLPITPDLALILSALVIIIMRFFNGGLMELVRRVRKWLGREKEPISAYE